MQRKRLKENEVVIVGAGPAGIAAAVQLRRYGFEPLVFEKHEVGGLLRNAFKVENYLGFPDGIKGVDLVDVFRKQLANYSVKLLHEEILYLDYVAGEFLFETNRAKYGAKTVVVASGTKPRLPAQLLACSNDVLARIYFEVVELKKLKNKKVVIVGAGDASFDYALTLEPNNNVSIFNRGERIRALPALQEYVKNKNSILYHEKIELQNIRMEGGSLDLLFSENGENININADYLLFAIGREPFKDFFADNFQQQVEALCDSGRLYLIGDVEGGSLRQTSVACAAGIKAAARTFAQF